MTITITDTFTQESVTIEEPDHVDPEHESWPPFIWIEGNYACDCNRAIFFDRAKGNEQSDPLFYRCSHGRFRVKIEQQGEETYDESGS